MGVGRGGDVRIFGFSWTCVEDGFLDRRLCLLGFRFADGGETRMGPWLCRHGWKHESVEAAREAQDSAAIAVF